MENTIDLSTTGQLVCIDQSRSGTFDGSLEIRLQLLNHSVNINMKKIII